MDNPAHDTRYAPPHANVEDVLTMEDGPQLASRGQRVAAVMLDTAFQIVALWLVSVLTPYNPWNTQGPGIWSGNLASMTVGILIFFLLNGYLLVTRGQTIGKVLLKIRITRPSGEPATSARLVLRYGAGFASGLTVITLWIYSLLDCLMIYRKSLRCLHDEIADTIVVRA